MRLIISKCISSVSYSILVNGEPTEFFKPTRGIRQGDPLSLYLFLLCFEGLTQLINSAVHAGKIRGYSLAIMGLKYLNCFLQTTICFFAKLNWEM